MSLSPKRRLIQAAEKHVEKNTPETLAELRAAIEAARPQPMPEGFDQLPDPERMAILAARGGRAGTGESKTRPVQHYQAAGAAGKGSRKPGSGRYPAGSGKRHRAKRWVCRDCNTNVDPNTTDRVWGRLGAGMAAPQPPLTRHHAPAFLTAYRTWYHNTHDASWAKCPKCGAAVGPPVYEEE